jgi:hypothetical protein
MCTKLTCQCCGPLWVEAFLTWDTVKTSFQVVLWLWDLHWQDTLPTCVCSAVDKVNSDTLWAYSDPKVHISFAMLDPWTCVIQEPKFVMCGGWWPQSHVWGRGYAVANYRLLYSTWTAAFCFHKWCACTSSLPCTPHLHHSFPEDMFFEPQGTTCCCGWEASSEFTSYFEVLKIVSVCCRPHLSSLAHVPSALISWFCSSWIRTFWLGLQAMHEFSFCLIFADVLHSFYVWFNH